MKKNKDTFLFGNKVVLVPYRKHHVLKYHEWMKSPELQELTASEPLTLDQEYEMQLSWLNDEDKCTFIVLDAETFKASSQSHKEEIESMVGDVNLFFNDDENKHSAEVEIMIAESQSRGKGYGKETLLAMFWYGVEQLKVEIFMAKIGYANQKSLNMFNKLKFTEVGRSDVFEEVTLELKVSPEIKTWITEEMKHLEIKHNPTEES